MKKGNINWKSVAEDLLWRLASNRTTKNAKARYYKVDVDGYEASGFCKGEIYPWLNTSSAIHPTAYHEVTWKELILELETKGFEEFIEDGHDCKACPKYKTCTAYFKDDPEQESCSGWKENN